VTTQTKHRAEVNEILADALRSYTGGLEAGTPFTWEIIARTIQSEIDEGSIYVDMRFPAIVEAMSILGHLARSTFTEEDKT
jgi:hypothetical protein